MGRPGLAIVAFSAAALGASLGAAGWIVTDHLEQDDDFCNACHVSQGLPLHAGIRRDYDARPALSLAGRHAAARIGDREDGAFRCIDCHGGKSFAGRLRVKTLAAKDALAYASGRFEEPERMRWPLWDEDCSACHASFQAASEDSPGSSRFHALPVHNVDLGVTCVECHSAHEPGGDPAAYFLRAAFVRAQCARCHSEFQEGG
jgi:nitrate/TMAO reductase-like tetraheme cytochrome c subunit